MCWMEYSQNNRSCTTVQIHMDCSVNLHVLVSTQVSFLKQELSFIKTPTQHKGKLINE